MARKPRWRLSHMRASWGDPFQRNRRCAHSVCRHARGADALRNAARFLSRRSAWPAPAYRVADQQFLKAGDLLSQPPYFILFVWSLVIFRQTHTPPSDHSYRRQRPNPSCAPRAARVEDDQRRPFADLALAPQPPSAPARTCAPGR